MMLKVKTRINVVHKNVNQWILDSTLEGAVSASLFKFYAKLAINQMLIYSN